MKKPFYLILTLVSFLLLSCSKDAGPESASTGGSVLEKGVLVLNEGAFLSSNASITLRNDLGLKSDKVFSTVNGKALGDVLQSAMEFQNSYFFVLNNSGKIEEVRKSDFASTRTFSDLRSPRYIVEIGGNRAMVTNFVYDTVDVLNEIDVLDLRSGIKLSQIPVLNWCEQMIFLNDKIFVANTGSNQILVINSTTLNVEREIPTPPQPTDLVLDNSGKIWVLCTGGFQPNQAALCNFSSQSLEMENIFRFSNEFAFPSRLKIDENGQTLYFIEGGVRKIDISSTSIPETNFITLSSGTPYSLGIEPVTGNVYVGDSKDFTVNGEVSIFNKDGVFIESFEAGVSPGNFLFR